MYIYPTMLEYYERRRHLAGNESTLIEGTDIINNYF